MADDETTLPQRSRPRFQFGLGAFLLAVLVSGPILAWLAIQLGFFASDPAVSGRITQSGKPAQNVAVSFVTPDNSFTAKTITDAAGKFSFKVPAGEYVVAIDAAVAAGAGSATINPQYRTPSTSGLRVSIKPGGNVVDIDLY
jgi:hypothetical protein